MGSPSATIEPRRVSRPRRALGLLAAIGFSLGMWACIAMAVLGLVLKILS
jgi:hypothetical protein